MAINPEITDTKILMQGIHFELTEAMKEAMREKFSRLFRHNERILRINVRLQKDQKLGTESHYTATAHLEIGGPDLVASAEGKEAYDLMDELVDILDRQLRAKHGKRIEKRRHPQKIDLEAEIPKTGEE